MPPIPTTIGPFRVDSLLGAGGMGEVYKAIDPTLGRAVAVKIVKADSNDAQYFKRLLREAQAYGRLKHPNIVTVYEAREAEGGLYIAMEYLEGQSLTAILNRDELSLDARVSVLIQILDALKYAHAQGIVHRDIKPSNIHVLADGTVKLLDFGLARVMKTETLTATDVVLGTPHYASPEQLKGEEIDGRTDVYSTGVVAFEMLTRRRPFDGNSLGSIVAKVLSEPTPAMETAWSHAFPDIEQIVRKAMAKSVADRYANAGEMQDALKRFLSASQVALRRERNATTQMPPAPIFSEPTVIQSPEPRTVRVEARPLPAAPVRTDPVPPPPRTPPPPLHAQPSPAPASTPQPPTTHPSSKGRIAMWAGAFGVLAGIVILSVMVGQRGSSGSSGSSGSGGSGGAGVPGVAQPANPGVPAEAPKPPTRNEPNNAPAPRESAGGEVLQTKRSESPARGSRQQAGADVQAVFIDPAGGDMALQRELVNALTVRGVTIATSAARARMSVNARIEISIRPAPVGGTTALTADFVATLQMRTAGGPPESRRFDGHALDFGEAVTRQAAYKRAAEQLAEAIDTAVRR